MSRHPLAGSYPNNESPGVILHHVLGGHVNYVSRSSVENLVGFERQRWTAYHLAQPYKYNLRIACV